MEVILLERIPRLGQMGDVVRVKDGFARNFLLPQGKALRANDANKAKFDTQRVELEARNLERKNEASAVSDKLDGTTYVLVRAAGETGQLYGSVAARDIAAVLDDNGFKIGRSQVNLNTPIKVIGLHQVSIVLHPEVESTVTINVARSEDEAERQAKGEDLSSRAAMEAFEDEQDADLAELFDNPEEAAEALTSEAGEGEEEAGSEEEDKA
ncbi:MAG: 50S ribosomal protein L9 [Nitratireductor sp.]|nr:50S ribosomal protein L9 [Nitratireductor sp.]